VDYSLSHRIKKFTSIRANITSLDDALTIAEAEGKTSALCTPSSTFIEAVDSCGTCVNAQSSNPSGSATVISSLLPYLDFCHLLSYSTLTQIVYLLPTNNAASTTTPPSSTTTSEKASRSTTPSRTSSTATQTSVDPQNTVSSSPVSGMRIPFNRCQLFYVLHLIHNFAATPRSHAWIAGPIVGSIVGLAILIGILYYVWRRRHRPIKLDTFVPMYDKAQLHSDCIPKPELDAQANTIHEMDAQPASPRHEMPVHGATAAELQTRDEAESVAADESRDLSSVGAGSAVSEVSSRSNVRAITRKPVPT
jgi:hypothetical protein